MAGGRSGKAAGLSTPAQPPTGNSAGFHLPETLHALSRALPRHCPDAAQIARQNASPGFGAKSQKPLEFEAKD
jgi:hypothetical protein